MNIEHFGIRLTKLRQQKNVSARDMSLSLGQNPGYINNIESGKALPSMKMFFYICEFLNITPAQFFDIETEYPHDFNELTVYSKKLTHTQLESITTIVKELVEK